MGDKYSGYSIVEAIQGLQTTATAWNKHHMEAIQGL